MKILVFLFLLISFVNSSNLLYLEKKNNKGVQTYCIDDDYYYDRNRMYFYDLKANYERSIATTSFQKIAVIGGYELNTYNDCIFDESKYYGLTYEQYNYLMAFYGIVLSFLISIALIMAV